MLLPLILAGPILRRVEPRTVTVWVALSHPAQVTLSVWENIANDGADEDLFSGPPPKFSSSPTPTLRVCANLHIALVTLDIPEPELLLPAHIYSYNLTISVAGGTHQGTYDLKSLGLLRDNMFDGGGNAVTENGHLHAALGYGSGDLPSFATPPPELTELRLLHYSCRRPHERGPDALSFVDKLIEENLRETSTRPHLLFMTGDQIYADDVAMPLLPILTELGQQLQGSIKEKITGQDGQLEISQENLPAGFRGEFIQSAAGFTTTELNSHLVSFGEYAAMYLVVWNNIFWPTPEPDGSFPAFKFSLFGDLLDRIEPTTDVLISTWKELFRPPDSVGLTAGELELFLSHIFITLPRDTLLKFLSSRKDEKFRPQTLEKAELPLVSGEEFNRHQLTYNFARSMTDERLKTFKAFVEWLQSQFLGYHEASKKQLDNIKLLYESLPQVRRAMANVPSYMMWDDHDITDDWNLTRDWRDQVLTKDAGVTVVRNGMVAGALFQMWGNDPKPFLPEPGDPDHPNSRRSQFLSTVQNLYPDGTNEVSQTAADAVNTLLGLDGAEPPPVKWHFSLDGPRYRVLVLDVRTRRTFFGRFTPPGLLSDGAIEEQIPEGPLPAGLGVLFVVSPIPVLGPPVDEEIARPLGVRVIDMLEGFRSRRPRGQIKMDMEWWSARPETFEKLLARLEPYKKVIFLSGDVHHGLGAELDYWKKGEAQPARFVQFTASPAKNILPARQAVSIAGSFAFSQRIIRLDVPIERMAWEELDLSPVSVPGGQVPTPRLRALLRREPVLIPIHPWPPGTAATRPADWSWRFKQLRDERPDAERPAPVRPKELPANFNALPRLEQYKELMERHLDYVRKNDFGRVFVLTNHIGLVRIATIETNNGDLLLEARHELHTIHPDQAPSGKPLSYTIHKGLLEPTTEAPPDLS